MDTIGLVSAEIAGEEGASSRLEELNWIGRVAAPANVLVVGDDSPFQSFEDIVGADEGVRFVAQGPGANDYLAPNILGPAYGFPFAVITGFAGSPEGEAQEVIDDPVALGRTGRTLIASPQMPEEKVTALREAFTCVAGNEELVAELEEQQRPLAVLDGEGTPGLVSEVLDSREELSSW